ncbi:MAG TPA: phosphoribosylformylglycinamidine cyclo-ligase [Acidimicrobiales bacterium]|nr:phosphoribosylformylglycinamidine cyclo-ligase [Acidimicrobiales bacterium]
MAAAAPRPGRATYAAAGVDIAAGDAAVERIKGLVASTARPGVLGGIGGFGGLFALDTDRYRRPVLVSATDGVGTKLLVARDSGRYGTVGVDLVAMCVDDLVCAGAEPLFFLDYVAVGRLVPERIEAVVAGIADGCRQAGCALIGGETAEHPGAMADDDLDLAGFAVGVVEHGHELGPHRVVPGDVLVGLPSPGLRSNGYSLARHVLLERGGRALGDPAWPGADRTVADELLRPSVIYAPAVLAAIAAGQAADGAAAGQAADGTAAGKAADGAAATGSGVHACAHITGGGIPGNLCRVLPADCDARLDRRGWEVPDIFGEIARLGEVAEDEMARVFNLGLGMVLVVDQQAGEVVLEALAGAGHEPVVVGAVVEGTGKVDLR